MRKTKEIVRLHHAVRRWGREIACTLGVSPATARECLRRPRIAGVDRTATLDLNDTVLEGRLYPPPAVPTLDERLLPDFAELHAQLKRKGVTLALLWEEYKAVTPDGVQYSQFCERYPRYSARVDLVMLQPHAPGRSCSLL